VNQDNWVYPGCPHTGPGIAVDAGGARHVVWYVGKEGSAGVYYQRVSGQAPGAGNPLPLIQAHTMPAAHTTVAALSGGRALAAYDMTAAGDRAVSVTLISADGTAVVSQPLPGSEGGQYPQVVATGPGTAVVAWIGKNGDRREIRLAAIRFEPDSDEGRVALRE
jgi:hypothetical protein